MRLPVFAATLITAIGLHAEVWTLDSCIDYAVGHNLEVAEQRLNERSGQLEITEARDAYLPSLSGGLSQNFAFGRGLTAENTYANRNTSSFGWNASMNLPLFQGLQAYRNEKLAKANLAALVEQTEATRDDVTLRVIAAYLQALYCAELTDVAEEQVGLSTVELNRRMILLENGKIAESEVYEAKAQVSADSLTLVNAQNDRQLALLDLAQLLRVDFTPDFAIAPLTDAQSLTPSADSVFARALTSNHSLENARLNINVADHRISVAKTGYFPRLNFQAGIGSSYYNLKGEENPSFSRQMRDNYATQVGLSLNVPIFDAFSTRNNIRRANIQKLQAELNYESAKDQLFRAINQAYLQAVSAERKHTAARSATESAKVALDAMTVKMEYGAANATEFEQAKTAYIKALAEEVQARYEQLLRNRILAFYNR